MTTVQKISRSLIDRSPSQPRTDFGDIEGLAASIRATGQTTPALLRKKANGRLEFVAGERRDRALELLERADIDAIVIEASDLDVAVRHLSSNDGLPLSPMEEACAYSHLSTEHGLTAQDVADKVGRSVAHVRSRLLLTQLHPELQEMFAAGRIKFASVARLAHTSEATQSEVAETLARLFPIGAIRTLDVLHALEHLTHRLDAAPFDIASETLTTAGPCGPCIFNTATQAAQLGFNVGEAPSDETPTCTKTECYSDKSCANEAIERADAERAGIRIMDESEMGLVLDAGRIRPSASWVAVDEPIDDDTEKTFRDLEIELSEADKDGQGYDSKRLALAFDHGRSILLMESDYAEPFIRAHYPRRAAQLRGELDPDVQAAKDAKQAEKEKSAQQNEIDAAVIALLDVGLGKSVKKKTERLVALLTAQAVGKDACRLVCVALKLQLKEDGAPIAPQDAIDRHATELDEEGLVLLSWLLIAAANVVNDALPDKALLSLLDLYGIDPKEVKKELARGKRNVKTRPKKEKKASGDAVEAPAE